MVKLNHLCLIAGIFFIALGVTVFAHAAACDHNAAPAIGSMKDREIGLSEAFQMNLFEYITDGDDAQEDIAIEVSSSGSILDCSPVNEGYLYCRAAGTAGAARITVKATDPCGKTGSKSFAVKASNIGPHIAVPNQEKSYASDFDRFLDLENYAKNIASSPRHYDVLAQTGMDLAYCWIDGNHYLSCNTEAGAEGASEIMLGLGDEPGFAYLGSFSLRIKNFAPAWVSAIGGQCINENRQRLIDLRKYALDAEDRNALSYSIVSQSNKNAANCFIQDANYVSCNEVSNLHSSNTLTIRAADSKGLYADTATAISTNCFADRGGAASSIIFQAPTKGACLETHSSLATRLSLANNSQERKCFRFFVDTMPGELDVSLSNDSICLNKGEASHFSLNANGNGASPGAYVARVFDPDNNIQLFFDYEVGSCSAFGGFRLEETDATVCQGQTREFTVIVTNTSDSAKTIALSADNSMTLPYFSRESIDLAAGASKAVQLAVNAKFAPLGKQRMALSGRAGNYAIEKKLDIDVVDCSGIKERTFLINAPAVCFDVSRGQRFENSFSVKALTAGSTSCDLYSRTVALQLYGIQGELSHYSLEMVCGEEKSAEFMITVPSNARAGKNYFTIAGTDRSGDGFVEEKQICLNVKGESNAGILVRTETKDIAWCGSEIFELELTNTGDFDENFNLAAAETPAGVDVSFSESFLSLPRGASRTIYVAISTSPGAEIGDNQSVMISMDGRIHLSAAIYFNIKGTPSFEDLEIVSASKEIRMKAGAEAEYSIILRNNSEKDFRGIRVSFENAPMDVNMGAIEISELLSGQTASLAGKISAGNDVNGAFSPIFVVTSGTTVNKRPLSLIVEGTGARGSFAGMFGMFGLGGDLVAGAGLAIFLIVAIALIVIGLAAAGKPAGKEAWAE